MTAANGERQLPPCISCGNVQVGNLVLATHQHVGVHPAAKRLWSRPLSTLNAMVCLGCGFTTFGVAELDKVRAAAEQHPEDFIW